MKNQLIQLIQYFQDKIIVENMTKNKEHSLEKLLNLE